MFPRKLRLNFLLFVVSACLTAWAQADQDTNGQVRSLLSNRCFTCHGPDAQQRQGGFRLDVRQSYLSPADSGELPVVPGDLAASQLWQRISSPDPLLRMPPAEHAGPLTEAEQALVARWINQGAQLPQHWSFVSPQRPKPPDIEALSTQAPHWSHPVDRFLLVEQLARRLQPSSEATRPELLRRVSLDLIGLPPTPAEVAAFEADQLPGAYERQVDLLLASPALGEHWARKWLDLARYADSAGYADDPDRTIWAYRDWVIQAINDNLSIDQFTIEQLAGDLLPNPSTSQLIATAFHRNTLTNNEGGTNDEEFRNVAIIDRINTTMAVWMGVTFNCAQCHSHKYDPFTQEEYFRLYAIFNQSQDADRRDESPLIEIYTAAQQKRLAEWRARAADIDNQLQHPTNIDSELTDWESSLRQVIWQRLKPEKHQSADGREGQVAEDNSIRVQSREPLEPSPEPVVDAQQSIDLSLSDVSGTIQAIGLRTIPDAAMPRGGVGWANGNFVLAGIKAEIVPIDIAVPSVPIKFSQAYATYSQDGYSAGAAIDDDPKSGWAVEGRVEQSQHLTLIPATPIEIVQPSILRLRLDHGPMQPDQLLASFAVETSAGTATRQWATLTDSLRQIHETPTQQRAPQRQQELAQFFVRNYADSTKSLRDELSSLQQQITQNKPTTTVPVMRELDPAKLRPTFVQLRGNYKALGQQVEPGTPAVFHPLFGEPDVGSTNVRSTDAGTTMALPQDESHANTRRPDRLDLARWLVDNRNPLTARVWVNRIWESLFGTGIVRTSEEFGAQGDAPTHPQLLDWLATELVELDWDFKAMLRMLVTTHSYCQTSKVSRELLELDRENVWLARGPRVRLTAEMIRDQALVSAGLLSRVMYGLPAQPPQPDLGLRAAFGSATDWTTSQGEDRYRRAIYTKWRRSSPYPSMATFDAPSREVCILRRDSTNTPLQALVTMNDPAFVEFAQALARRVVLDEFPETADAGRMQAAFQYCTCRLPSQAELETLLELLRKSRDYLADKDSEATQLATVPYGALPPEARAVELAAWTAVCNVLMNLDEVLMKR